MNNRDYYHRSSVDPKYSQWTEKGLQAFTEYMLEMSRLIQSAEDQARDRRAKELVIKGLKGEKV